jgi:YidC/Oxa1 family membrane protein insertase
LTSCGLKEGSGVAWIYSIILLTIFIRLCILPVFMKTIKATRKMQTIQPELQAIQKKYKGKKDDASKQALASETMALYQKNGANPLGGCLPMLIQTQFFISLWKMLSHIQQFSSGEHDPIGPISQQLASDIENTHFFGITLSQSFQNVDSIAGHITIGVMIVIMCAGMFISQRLVMLKNMPIAAKEGQQFKMQKSMVYIFPLMYIFSGVMFPGGLLIYMVTTNLWTLGQGVWQIKFIPTPGSEAAHEKEEKLKRAEEKQKQELKVSDPEEYEKLYGTPDEKKQQRQQPKRKKTNKGAKK